MKPLTLSVAVIVLLALPASSPFAASNDRHHARSRDGVDAGAYGYDGAPRARSFPEVSGPLGRSIGTATIWGPTPIRASARKSCVTSFPGGDHGALKATPQPRVRSVLVK